MVDSADSPDRIGDLLAAWLGGDESAFEALYPHLKRLAHRARRRERRFPIDTTSLAHELFLKLVGQVRAGLEVRERPMGLVTHMIRRLLVDRARLLSAGKRGGGAETVRLSETLELEGPGEANLIDVLTIDELLTRLFALHPEQARVVEMRFFSGCTVDEVARALEVSSPTVERHWTAAKLWLRHQLSDLGRS